MLQNNDTHRVGYAISLHNLYAGGLIAISLVIIQDFLNANHLDTPAFLSVLALAIALPLLSGTFVLNVVEQKFKKGPSRTIIKIEHITFTLSVITDVFGIGAAFWHASFFAGIAFIFSVLVFLSVYGAYIVNLEEQDRDS